MHYFYLTLFALSLNAIHASIFSNLKSMLVALQGEKDIIPKRRDTIRYFVTKKPDDEEDKKSAQNKANVLRSVRAHEENLNIGRDIPSSKFTGSQDRIGREYFHMDPVLNELRRKTGINRRKGSSYSASSSDSQEQFWRDQWDEHWMQKKFEALNSTQPRGDVVNMVAARPWGVPCGDPNQHDMPWGSCMLPAECDAEYRIFRGDSFCGRTTYVCCALQVSNYDMYQGLDLSFEGSSFETDSNEKKSGEVKKAEKKKRDSKKRKRKRDREKRKKKIEKSIRNIIKEIRSILMKSFRNGTAQRHKKTRELKRFIEIMKKQYKKDRKSVVDVHEHELVKIDEKLQSKLDKIKGVNEGYMTNDTFRDIVVNGTVNKQKLRSFLRAHPDMATYFEHRRNGLNLKPQVVELDSKSEMVESKSEEEEPESGKKKTKVLDYDLEYGMLYY